jgi:dihydrodipicolinate synthase/N-acetylneuraminate lyase
LLGLLFPGGVPQLWCPPLTHYSDDGAIDRARIAAHLKHLSRHVKAFLIPGSTGDGWELNEDEVGEVLDTALAEAKQRNVRVLIGALRPGRGEAKKTIVTTVKWLKARTKANDDSDSMLKSRVCGFAVCPPRGAELSQGEIHAELESILGLGLPVALYQLPQVTQNEMSPELVADLAARFPNFILFKDTSGKDRVAASGLVKGVFLARGAEGDYARWLQPLGPYQGWLLSTANCFASQLHRIASNIADPGHKLAEAHAMSMLLSHVVNEAFRLVASVKDGNAFANANKAMDHFFAHGPGGASVSPPRLHAGGRLPKEVIRATGELLANHGLMPKKGYLE